MEPPRTSFPKQNCYDHLEYAYIVGTLAITTLAAVTVAMSVLGLFGSWLDSGCVSSLEACRADIFLPMLQWSGVICAGAGFLHALPYLVVNAVERCKSKKETHF